MIKTKSIWLDTKNCVVNTDRTVFTFNDLPLIQVRGNRSVLKVNTLVMDTTSENAHDYKNHVWIVKLGNIKYNREYYFNSDKESIPTIASVMVDTYKGINNNLNCLELTPQDINQLVMYVKSSDNHGLTKGGHTINMYINIIIEEQYD
jgi:hypothetical protein